MAGGGCLPQLLAAAGSGSKQSPPQPNRPLGGPAAAMDDLVGETILSYLTVRLASPGVL